MKSIYSAKKLLQQGKIIEARHIFEEILQKTSTKDVLYSSDSFYHHALYGHALTSFYLDETDIESEFQKCHHLFIELSNPELLLCLFQVMTEYYIEKKQYNDALKHIDEAKATLTGVHARVLQAAFEFYKIIILSRENLPHKARSLLHFVEQNFSEELFFHMVEGHLEVKAEIAKAEGQCQAAQFLFEDAAVHSKKIGKFNEMMFLHRGAIVCDVKTDKSQLLHKRSLDIASELNLKKRELAFKNLFSKLYENNQQTILNVETPQEKSIRLYGFGNMRVYLDQETDSLSKSDWQSEKARKLFLYLLLSKPSQCIKDKIIDKIWPETHDQKKLNNSFHVTLSSIRKLMRSPELITTNEGLYTVNTNLIWIDWIDFQTTVENGIADERKGNIENAYNHFNHAKSLYLDDFLVEFSDDWIAEKRDDFKKLLEKCIQHYGNLLEEDRMYEDALALMEELIKINPIDDYGYQSAIRLAGLLGKKAMATKYYETYREMLKEEFGCGPSPSFIRLYDQFVLKH